MCVCLGEEGRARTDLRTRYNPFLFSSAEKKIASALRRKLPDTMRRSHLEQVCRAFVLGAVCSQREPRSVCNQRGRGRDGSVRVRVCLGISIKDGSVARDEGARRQIHTLSDV